MAQDYLCSAKIGNQEEIAVHPRATHYCIKNKQIKFFRVNPKPSTKMKPIPRNVNTVRFPDYQENMNNTYYGTPEFRGHGKRRDISDVIKAELCSS